MTSASRIAKVPDVCGGEPTIAGTRVPVRSIVMHWQYYQDMSRVRKAFPRVDDEDIRSALAYYEEHREEIDRAIEENESAAYATD